VAASAVRESRDPASEIVNRAAHYEHGESVTRDSSRALTLYCEAAQLGDESALLNLGWMFLNGRGVPRDDAIAVAWFRRAADKGVVQAKNLLSLLRSVTPAENVSCGPAPRLAKAPSRLRTLVQRTAKDVGIDSELVLAVIAVESDYDSRAVSRRDAQGLMQLMPETAARLGVQDPFDDAANVRAGATYLKSLLQQFQGNLTLALAAYNAGEGAVEFYGGVPPYRETRDYIDRVKRLCACDRASP
jgi:soluble lytic murein transglycosylase-like protein